MKVEIELSLEQFETFRNDIQVPTRLRSDGYLHIVTKVVDQINEGIYTKCTTCNSCIPIEEH